MVGTDITILDFLADELEWYQPLLALLLGLFFATLAYRFFHDPRHPGRVTLCFVGFGIAMVWILMIVNEVVGVLQVSTTLPPSCFEIELTDLFACV